MKKIKTILIAVFITVTAFAQAPQKMSYQAVIRNSSNVLVASTPVGIKISILQGSTDGNPVYVETQTVSTDVNGLATLAIGEGKVVSGNFANIDWSNGSYY